MSVITESVLTDVLITIPILVASAVLIFFKWRFGYWKRRGVQHLPPTIPFGNSSELFKQRIMSGNYFKNLYNVYKDKSVRYFGCYLLATPVLVLSDLDLIKLIMTKDFDHFTDHINYVNVDVDPLTGHLFGLKGSKWRNLRTKLTPTFTSGKMKMMFQTLVDCSEGLIEVMDKFAEEFEPIDIKDVVSRFTTDIIGSCAFGIECNSLKNLNTEFRSFSDKIFKADKIRRVIRFLSFTFPLILDTFKLRMFDKELSDFFIDLVKETIDYREKNNVIRKDFMHLLIQLKNNISITDEEHVGHLSNKNENLNSEKGLTLNELAAQAFVFFAAGFETSSTALTFCFYELVQNPDIQNKLREEIKTILDNHHGEITYAALAEMTYMDKCIQETLRKYPPIPILFRRCTKTYKIPDSDVIIKKGMQVFIPIFGIQSDEKYYPEPDKFDPERFNAENKSKRHPFAWLPFGEGPRLCIGLRFSMMQMKVGLTVLLKNYEFTLNFKTKVPIVLSPKSVILTAKDGVWLNAKRIVD